MEAKYLRIYKEFYYAIKSGRYREGDVLPGEAQICAAYGVSRITAAHALDELRRQGLVSRVRRKGTVVLSREFARGEAAGTVAVVFSSFDNFNAKVQDGLKRLAAERNLNLTFFDSARSEEHEREILTFLLTQPLAGLILMPLSRVSNLDLIGEFRIQRTPVAFLDFAAYGILAPAITSDNFGGMYALTEYLVRAGHTDIGFFPYSDRFFPTETERFDGFCRALVENGIPVNPSFLLVRGKEFERHLVSDATAADPALAERAVDDYLRLVRRPTAVVCVNDSYAQAFLRAAGRRGLRIPDDVSVTGFDNLAAAIRSNITTAAQDFGEMARTALLALLRQITKPGEPPDYQNKIRTVLIERGSVRNLRPDTSSPAP